MSEVAEQTWDQPMPVGEIWTQCPNNGYDILVQNGDFVGAFVHDDTYASTSRARCARAVAAVNACSGIPTADLAKWEVGAVKGLRDLVAAIATDTLEGVSIGPRQQGMARAALAACPVQDSDPRPPLSS